MCDLLIMRKEEQSHFIELREKYPVFTYHHFDFSIDEKGVVSISFDFRLGDDIRFTPKMKLKPGKHAMTSFNEEDLRGIVFHIGMIELISYWKSACAPTIHIRQHSLSPAQQAWWKKLYWKGLGEFFYQNTLTTNCEDFVHFTFEQEALPIETFHYVPTPKSHRVIVPIGGGKDSVVTLEALSAQQEVIPFIINPRGATLDCARIANFPNEEDIVILEREIDPQLLTLNKQGFLNGHTPFSAMLAFYTLLVSYVTNTHEIALSNESSANEPTIPGTEINHQYSKSLEFEEDFRRYVRENMQEIAHYYSYLRPYSELEIAEMFALHPKYFPVFRSCNAGSKENRWCCECPKCLFTAIILAPFVSEEQLLSIFGEDLLDKPSLEQYFDELTGIAAVKPFECVGTLEEVNKAIQMVQEKYAGKELIRRYGTRRKGERRTEESEN